MKTCPVCAAALSQGNSACNNPICDLNKPPRHTPTPWEFHPNEPRIIFGEVPDRGQQTKPGIIAYLETTNADWEANRDRIIRAVNNHDALIARLEQMEEWFRRATNDENPWEDFTFAEAHTLIGETLRAAKEGA